MRYANTRRYYERDLKGLFVFASVDHPRLLTESVILAWCGQGRANNTVRNTLSRVCTFLRWCVRQGEADGALVEVLMSRDHPLRQMPRLYGKVQGAMPARWLTHEEAFERLVGACLDGTDLGLRDEAIIRLGLAGLRAAEIIHLRIGDLRRHDDDPQIGWIGKKRRARRVGPGPSLIRTLDTLIGRRQDLLGRSLRTSALGRTGSLTLPINAVHLSVQEDVMVTKDHRRELRLSSSDDDLITEAAGLLGMSVSEFLLGRAVADAEAIVDAHRTIRLQEERYGQFLAVLDSPARPLPKLLEQIRKSRALKHAD